MRRAGLQRRLSTALRLAGVALAALTLASFAPSGVHALDLLEHFRLQYAWVGTGLAVLLLAVGAWRTAGLTLVAVLANLWIVWPHLGLGGGARAALDGDRLKLLWANVYYWNDDADALVALVRAERPDLVVMAELTPALLKRLEPLGADYPHVFECAGLYYCQLAVLSRRPFERAELLHDPLTFRRLLRVDVRVADTALGLFATHLTSPMSVGRARLHGEQVAELAQRLAPQAGPLVLVGDLNATPWSRALAALREGARPTGGVPGADELSDGGGLAPTWPAGLPSDLFRLPIDHVLARGGARIVTRRSGPPIGSDHLPIIAEIAVTRAPR